MPKQTTEINPKDQVANSRLSKVTTTQEDQALQTAKGYLQEVADADRILAETTRQVTESERAVQELRHKRSKASDPAERQELTRQLAEALAAGDGLEDLQRKRGELRLRAQTVLGSLNSTRGAIANRLREDFSSRFLATVEKHVNPMLEEARSLTKAGVVDLSHFLNALILVNPNEPYGTSLNHVDRLGPLAYTLEQKPMDVAIFHQLEEFQAIASQLQKIVTDMTYYLPKEMLVHSN